MKFCLPHWDALRAAIEARGLSALVAESGQQAMSNLTSELNHGPSIDNFDPLMGAHWAIIGNLADVDPRVLFADDCPLCYANRMHEESCRSPLCTGGATYFDQWIGRAADDQVTEWKSRGEASMTDPQPADREGVVADVIVLMACGTRAPTVAGTITVTATCGHRAFMAPTTVAYLADGHSGVRLVCSRCFNAARMPEYDLRLMPGSLAEAEATLGVGGADQLMAWARDVGFK